MALYPLGLSDDGSADSLLFRQQADIRRLGDPLEPLPDVPRDPFVVPVSAWRKVQAEDIKRRAGASAVIHDSTAMEFNIRVQQGKESKLPPRPTGDQFRALNEIGTKIPGLNEQQNFQKALSDYRIDQAIAQMQRSASSDKLVLGRFDGPEPRVDFARARELGQRIGLPDPLLSVLGAGERVETAIPRITAATLVPLEAAIEFSAAAFDGKRFVKHIYVNQVAGLQTGFGLFADEAEARRQTSQSFDAWYEDLPRPAQIVIEELSPGNAAIVIAGGGLARLLEGSGSIGGRALAGLVRPLTSGPTAFPREVALNAGGRIGWEYTDGAPLPIRLMAGGLAGIYAANPESVTSSLIRGAKGSLKSINAIADNTALSLAAGPSERSTLGALVPRIAGGAPDTPPSVIPLSRAPTQLRDEGARLNEVLPAVDDALARAANLAGRAREGYVPPTVADTLTRMKALDEHSPVETFLNTIPGIGNAARFLKPALGMKRYVIQSYAGKQAAMQEFLTRTFPSRQMFFEQMVTSFGDPDLIDAPSVRYMGLAKRPLRGVDVPAAEHPLTGKMVDVLEHPGNYDLTREQRQLIHDFNRRNLDLNASVRREYGVEIGDFNTPPETRGAHVSQPTEAFVPIVRKNEMRAGQSSDLKASAVSGRLKPREYDSIADTFADVVEGEAFDPELSVKVLFTALDEAKARAAGNEVFRWGIGGIPSEVAAENRILRKGMKPVTELGIWLPEKEAADVARLMDIGNQSKFAEFIEGWRQIRLNGDISPLTIQGSLSWFASPIDSSRQLLGGLRRGLADGDVFRGFREGALARDITADPERWMDFAFHSGLRVAGGTPEEFSIAILARLPGLKTVVRLNEGMFTGLLRSMKRDFDEISALLIREGTDPDVAKQTAGRTVTRIVPFVQSERLGISPKRARTERMLATSVSFIRQPASFMAEATQGYVKLGLRPATALSGEFRAWSRLTPSERMATQMFSKMMGTGLGLAAFSAAMTADRRNLDVDEAIMQAVTPGSGGFMRFHIPGTDFSLPLLGPYRGLIQAVIPRDGIPFRNLYSYFENRLTPAVGTAIDIAQNRDFFEELISSGEGPRRILDALAYAAEQALPIAVSEPFAARRRGFGPMEGAQSALTQFFGQNVSEVSRYGQLEQDRRGGAIDLLRDPANMEAANVTDEQRAALVGARTLDDLREKIGTRAANAYSEGMAPGFPDSLDEYVQDLRRRADRGDRVAQGLLVSVETQARLNAAVAEGLDRPEYRARRATITSEQRGKSQAFEDVFANFGGREAGVIDQLTGEYYDLFNLAERADGTVDFDLFNDLEAAFIAKVGREQFALVEANANASPRGANPMERELRETRVSLEGAKFWKIDDASWKQMVSEIKEDVKDDPELLALVEDNRNFFDAFRALVDVTEKELIADGISEETAREYAKQRLSSHRLVKRYNRLMEIGRADWAAANPDLAQAAIKWGYLSASKLNIGASEAVEETPPPQSKQIEQAPDVSEMASLFKAGSSYGQLAIKFKRSRGSVEQALRRHFGGSPLAQREST